MKIPWSHHTSYSYIPIVALNLIPFKLVLLLRNNQYMYQYTISRQVVSRHSCITITLFHSYHQILFLPAGSGASMDWLNDSLDSLNFCLLFFSFWWIALRKLSSFLLMGEGRDELSKARFWSGMSRDSCCLRRAVLLLGCLEESGEESELSERDKTGLISSVVAIL